MKNLIYLLFILISNYLFGQILIPEFQFTLKIENSKGQLDSVILGFDVRKSSDLIDSLWGETDISNIPIKNSLDMRESFDVTSLEHAKKLTSYYNCKIHDKFESPPGTPGSAHLGFYTSEFPVKIRWDKELFRNDTCRHRSFLTRINWTTFDFYEEWQLFTPEAYLAETDSLILTLDYLNQTNYAYWARRNYYDITLEDGKPGIFYMFHIGVTGKSLKILLDNQDILNPIAYQISPNPGTDKLHYEFSQKCDIGIYDINGVLLYNLNYQIPNSKEELNISELAPGYYLLKCNFSNSRSITKSFIKI